MPAAYRKILAEQGSDEVIICKGIDAAHIDVYHPKAWEEQLEKFTSMASNSFSQKYRQIMRNFSGQAAHCKFDSQGRIMLTPVLMKMCGISPESKVWFVGLNDLIEIWDSETYENYQKDSPLNPNDLDF